VIEHRQQQRFERKIPIEYSIGDVWESGFTKNMSIGGLYIVAEEPLPILGTRLKVKFKVTTQKELIEVGAQVRWADSGGFGVQFDGLRARDVWALGKFLEQPG
jgi:hypothetical protein